MRSPAQCQCVRRGAVVPCGIQQPGSSANLVARTSWGAVTDRAIHCTAEAPSAPDQLSNLPVERAASGGKKKKSLRLQPQYVQLRRKSSSSSQKDSGKYKQARHRLTVALLEADVDTAIDAISEFVFDTWRVFLRICLCSCWMAAVTCSLVELMAGNHSVAAGHVHWHLWSAYRQPLHQRPMTTILCLLGYSGQEQGSYYLIPNPLAGCNLQYQPQMRTTTESAALQ